MDFILGGLAILLFFFGIAFCYSAFYFMVYVVWWFMMLPFKLMIGIFNFFIGRWFW
ncbi:hypothetical protein R078138_00514 [Convivina praedatoris]|uniref:TMhelix containing protein n=1 Tax=Convivina praedatoris TaxID=2880963 RepID=A0ABN8H844_9LACO|nr:hypothetical protein LMG032447_00504 [Convivina sp. LMG 32447]CAH1852174.1 hypothetical protein R078138_00514 [Convivina sp. LMG 32447]CAH1852770.1 hypothetical protein R077815_00603 [Convivina sp. LMG 32447]CAH1856719.1 hypothetical protein R078131_01459 [Convivina intestini]